MIKSNASLLPYNTFGIEASAKELLLLQREEDLPKFTSRLKQTPILILGGGSNVLFTKDFPGNVLINQIKGKRVIEHTEKRILVEAGGGEDWHDFVSWCVKQGYAGLENLSLIPGKVGAAPIQNIGAYGVELKDLFYYLEAIELSSGKKYRFNKSECQFAYRDSRFKQDWKGRFLITKVVFDLLPETGYSVKLDYGIIRQKLQAQGITDPDIRQVAATIIDIRQEKLPDPKLLGNAGSFFKNPSVEKEVFEALKSSYPKIPHYLQADGLVKIPAAWLIDQCSWKGKRVGNTGCYKNQALVIVNYGGASGKEIWDHAQKVAASVQDRFGLTLTPEVNLID